jgi:hypothetical protein
VSKIPEVLYRGDRAARRCPNGSLVYVSGYKSMGLHTNLICGGQSNAVARLGLRAAVAQHIRGWATSHFLSFSKNLGTAEFFAKKCDPSKQLYPHQDEGWEAVIFELHKTDWTWTSHALGIYIGSQPTNQQKNGYIALLDNVTLLSILAQQNAGQFAAELSLATSEKEWLVIPLDPINLGIGATGLTAQLLPGAVHAKTYLYDPTN